MKTNPPVFSRGQGHCMVSLAVLLSSWLSDAKKPISEQGEEPEHEPEVSWHTRYQPCFLWSW